MDPVLLTEFRIADRIAEADRARLVAETRGRAPHRVRTGVGRWLIRTGERLTAT